MHNKGTGVYILDQINAYVSISAWARTIWTRLSFVSNGNGALSEREMCMKCVLSDTLNQLLEECTLLP